jgi:hemoglobin
MTTSTGHDDRSLYARVGGQPAVAAAVDGLYDRILADPELRPYFEGVGIERLKGHQRAFITVALGGPDRYVGRPLDGAHLELGITHDAFAHVVAHLIATLRSLGVDQEAIDAIVGALGPLQPQIVAPA